MKRELVQKRNRILNTLRRFFNDRDFLEVETPVLSPYLIPESTIEVFETTYYRELQGSRQLYLTPSPEIFMKKLIAEGFGNIFQITKSFRNYEQTGRDHNPEFTMLEWYATETTAEGNIPVTEELFASLLSQGNSPDLSFLKPPFRRISMEEIFFEKTGIDLSGVQKVSVLKEAVLKKGYRLQEDETWESLFNRVFLNEVEPFLPVDSPLVLYNYPAQIDCLAADIPGTPWKDRWELYAGGIELANCYTEETNPRKVSSFVEKEYARKAAHSLVIPDADFAFSSLFTPHHPQYSGVALGVDRLIRLLTGEDSIKGVILFPLSDTIV